jgi:hypothetical protein
MSTSTDAKEPDIEITEQPDGSVAVALPEDLAPPSAQDDDDDPPQSKAEGGPADDPADADADDDTEALRNAKRERRRAKRELARKTSAEKDQRLQLLQRQNQELMERLSVVERKTHAGELAKLDRAVEDCRSDPRSRRRRPGAGARNVVRVQAAARIFEKPEKGELHPQAAAAQHPARSESAEDGGRVDQAQ